MGRIELNLLVVFDVLMQERSARRSAVRLAMTERAVSQALERLQSLVGDTLFEGEASGLRPTPCARAMVVPVRNALRSIREEDHW